MRWWQSWLRVALVAALAGVEYDIHFSKGVPRFFAHAKGWSARRKLDARDKTRDLWYHGYNSYMRFAFPLDELMPLSCTGKGPDWENPHNIASNDVAGNFSLTLIDVLDTFVILNDRDGFNKAVRNVIDWVSFDVNTKPQVFETTIRVLGGLLSAHIFAADSSHAFYLPWYGGQLLEMAHDLGQRLLPAFSTPTGIPYARLNLRHGVPIGESRETCTAGAGSLILEFGTLSRLTGDDRFEKAAFKAFFALWNRKSDLGLVGNTIHIFSGKWLSPEVTGIGAGVDSFYEYALKWYVLSGEVEFLDVWHEAYAAIMRYSRGIDGFWYRPVNIHTGVAAYNTVDSLSAFWPGLQVLAGDIENAIKSHLIYWNLWRLNSGLPEVWDINFRQVTSGQYPLRPEFIESTYYLYRATQDSFYLDVGERVLYDLISRAKVDCGLCGISDLKTNKRDDRMESFVLSETLKYLYLLFDESNPIHKDESNYVFTTEGHILTLHRQHLKPLSPIRRKLRRLENLQCPAYRPFRHGVVDSADEDGLVGGVPSRPDVEYARILVGTVADDSDERWWSVDGVCEVPITELYAYDFILSVNGEAVAEDLNPNASKLLEVDDGFILHNVTGIRTHVVSRLDGKGYDIVKLGPHAVRRGQIVYVNDSALTGAKGDGDNAEADLEHNSTFGRSPFVRLRVFLDALDQMMPGNEGQEPHVDLPIVAFTSSFGPDPALSKAGSSHLRFQRKDGNLLFRPSANVLGCNPYEENTVPKDSVVLARRGECTFIEKLVNAGSAGASGVIVINTDDQTLNPSADREDIARAGALLNDAVLVVISQSAGEDVLKMMELADVHGFADVMVAIEPEGHPAKDDPTHSKRRRKQSVEENRILYLNGHPLLNTRLLV